MQIILEIKKYLPFGLLNRPGADDNFLQEIDEHRNHLKTMVADYDRLLSEPAVPNV